MTVRIGDIEFDHVDYDGEVDVLYLHVGDPEAAEVFDASAEGHALRYDDRDRLVGITLVNPRLLMQEQGRVMITTPDGVLELDRAELARAISPTAA